jgi:hypothetical protein
MILLIVFCGGAVYGQGIITGGISGTVVDPTEAIIPGAMVKVEAESTGTTFQVNTNVEGAFQISNLPIGMYTVTVTASGFGTTLLSHVGVVAGNSTPLKVLLSLGKTAETVQVQASASELINTDSAQGETLIQADQLATVPVGGAFDNVALMVPGVVQTHNDSFTNTNGVNFSVNGQRGRSNNSEIDGQTNNDNDIGGPSFFFSNQDALQEVQVVTSEMGAQYGRNMGSVVNYITKQGTNTFHGSAFEYYLGSWGSSLLQSQKDPQWGFCPPGSTPAFANANGCQLPTVPRFVENRYGGTFGGPVIKDKLWLFGSTFFAREFQAGSFDTSGSALFPDPNGLTQLKSAYPNNPATVAMVANGPYANPQGNPVPVGSPQMVPVTDGNTASMIEMAPVGRSLSAHVLDQEDLGRLDYQVTPKDRFYLRYAYQDNPWIPAWYLYTPAGVATGGYSEVPGSTYEVGGDWTHTFTPSVTDQLRYAFQQSEIAFEGGGLPTCTSSNLSSCTSLVQLSLGASGSAFGYGASSLITPGGLPQGRFVRVNQVQDNASWNHTRHTFMFGGEFDYQDSPNFGLPNSQGNFNFTPGASGLSLKYPASSSQPGGGCYLVVSGQATNPCNNGFSGFLQGNGTLTLAEGPTTLAYKEPDYAFYFQDNWKLLQNLTLDLGLRYEYFGQAVNLLHTSSVAQQTGPHPFWSTALPLSATTFPYINPDHRNVEPRVGLAYTPKGLAKMVVHAGFAINVDPAFYNIFLNAAQSSPVVNANTIVCNGTTVNCMPSSGTLNLGTVQATDSKYLPIGGDPRLNTTLLIPTNFRNPMAETYTLGVQYQITPAAVWEVRYVGSHTFGQFQALNTNPDVLDVQSAFANYGPGASPCTNSGDTGYTRENCDYGLVETVGNTAFLIYNALQTSLTVRDFHHITGTAAYTYSRAISNTSEIFSTGAGGNTNAFAQDPLSSDIGERGVDGNSYPSLLGVQLTFSDPWFSKQNGILGRLLGGYFLNTFYQYNGGQPFSPSQAFSVTSSNVSIPATDSPQVAAEVTSNFCDLGFARTFGSQCRPILANNSAPISSVGINVGNGVYENYATGAVGPRSSFHWLWNNQAEALAMGNPFPGVGRNTLRGDSWNDLDASVGKSFKAAERVSAQLTLNVFNVMNRAYYATPDLSIEDSVPGLFMTNTFTGYNAGTAAGGGAYYAGFGNRNIELSAKISF